MSERLFIFDTTLRDGEQVPGCQLNTIEKIEVARALEALGVDVIEAGFPVSSPGDFNSVREISKAVSAPTICALTRAVERDIDVAADALALAKHKRIHTGIGVSPEHIYSKLKSTPDAIVERAVAAVKYAKKYVEDVEFYAEDAGRADEAFLARVVEAVIKAGATVVNIPDTTGYCLPEQYGAKIKYLMEHVDGVHKAILSTHCHNDLGMATANTLSGVINGARQVEVTINGIGERAGNTSRRGRDGPALPQTSRCRHRYQFERTHLGQPSGVEPDEYAGANNKAIVSRNAFAHSSGIHQDGVLKDRGNYEIIDPKDVGLDESVIALTARSGRAALHHRLDLLGIKLEQHELDEVYEKFLVLADKKKDVRDDDLLYLVGDTTGEKVQKHLKLKYLQILSGTLVPTATVIVEIGGMERTATSTGNGPIDAAVRAIKSLIQEKVLITGFLIQAMNRGSDDVGRVHMRVLQRKSACTVSAHTDTVRASVEAFVDALNLLGVTGKKEE